MRKDGRGYGGMSMKRIVITGLGILILAACFAVAVFFLANLNGEQTPPGSEYMENEGRYVLETSEYMEMASGQLEKIGELPGEMTGIQEENLSYALDTEVIWGEKIGGESLTLEDVVRLSEKGWELSWTDFDGYAFLATGSGLVINVYPIDHNFSLSIGGDGGGNPMYIYLHSNVSRDWIEIREEDVEAFIEEWGELEPEAA